jgi:hypothetical protein
MIGLYYLKKTKKQGHGNSKKSEKEVDYSFDNLFLDLIEIFQKYNTEENYLVGIHL